MNQSILFTRSLVGSGIAPQQNRAIMIERDVWMGAVYSVEVFESLAYLNAEQTVPYLVKALQDDHAEVRFWAAFALGHLGDSTVIKDLERISSDETLVAGWGTVGREALEAINHISNRMQLKG